MRVLSSIAFALAIIAAPARADLASGTPLFTCTAPTLQTDGTTIPATGPQSLAGYRWYLDSSAAATKSTTACAWQTAAGDIASGAHSMRVSAVQANGGESAKTGPLAFTVPTPTALAPSGLTVQ